MLNKPNSCKFVLEAVSHFLICNWSLCQVVAEQFISALSRCSPQ